MPRKLNSVESYATGSFIDDVQSTGSAMKRTVGSHAFRTGSLIRKLFIRIQNSCSVLLISVIISEVLHAKTKV